MYRTDKQFMTNPATSSCRVYIGGLPKTTVIGDLEEKFMPHGKVLGLVLQQGFAFVQYEEESQSQAAINSENNSMLHGKKITVKQAMDKSRGGPPQQNRPQQRPGGPPQQRQGPQGGGGGGPPSFPGPNQQRQGPPQGGGPPQRPGPQGPGAPNQQRQGPRGQSPQQRPGPPFQRQGSQGGPNQQRQGPPGGPNQRWQGGPSPNQQRQGPPGGPNQQRQGPDIPHQQWQGHDGPHQQRQGPDGPHQQRSGSDGPHQQRQGPDGPHHQRQGLDAPNQQRQGPDGPNQWQATQGQGDQNQNMEKGPQMDPFSDEPIQQEGETFEDDAAPHEPPVHIPQKDNPPQESPQFNKLDKPHNDKRGRKRNRGKSRDRFPKHNFRDDKFYPRDDFKTRGPPPVAPPIIDQPDRNDCEIIVVSKQLTKYAEYIEQRLKSLGLLVDLLFPNEDVPIGRVLANISSRGCLYAILVTPTNEENRSLTLNILHGLPQEHRNMPLEDALILITRNFDSYMRGDKTVAETLGPGGVLNISDRHPTSIQLLLNLLAENRQLSSGQYDKLLKYLQEKRELQTQHEVSEGVEQESEESSTKQTELQNRIMNILNKSADAPPEEPKEAPPPLLQDPTVQKALDSLLVGEMFKSIAGTN